MDKRALFKDAIERNPDDPFPHYALAIENREAGEIELALDGLKTVRERFPDYVATYFHLGGLLVDNDEIEFAKQVYQEGMQKAEAAGDAHALTELQGAYSMIA